MTLEQFLAHMRAGHTVTPNSEAHQFMHAAAQEALRLTAALNGGYHTAEELHELFSQLIGKPVDESFGLFSPFYTDFGKNITLGKRVFLNSGCRFQDQGGITIGDGALIGHNVVLATLNHDLAPGNRAAMHPAPIVIGRNVWIGASSTVVPGVTIGDGAILAAGAVATGDIPANTVAAGVPARVIRCIREEDSSDETYLRARSESALRDSATGRSDG